MVKLFIPGVIFTEYAFVKTVRPTVSKEVTAGGWPLWVDLDIDVEGFRPANTDDIVTMLTKTMALKGHAFVPPLIP